MPTFTPPRPDEIEESGFVPPNPDEIEDSPKAAAPAIELDPIASAYGLVQMQTGMINPSSDRNQAELAMNMPSESEREVIRKTLGAPGYVLDKSGRLLKAGFADTANLLVGDGAVTPEAPFENVGAAWENEEMPVDATTRNLPTGQKILVKGAGGLAESAPRLALVAAAGPAGMPVPLAGAAAFGLTPEGVDVKQAAIGALLPAVGKYTGAITEAMARQAGVSSETALAVWNKIGGAGGAAGVVGADLTYEISKLPEDKRAEAWTDAAANIGTQLIMGMMGERVQRLPEGTFKKVVSKFALRSDGTSLSRAEVKEIYRRANTGEATPEELDLIRRINSELEAPGQALRQGVTTEDTVARFAPEFWKSLGIEGGKGIRLGGETSPNGKPFTPPKPTNVEPSASQPVATRPQLPERSKRAADEGTPEAAASPTYEHGLQRTIDELTAPKPELSEEPGKVTPTAPKPEEPAGTTTPAARPLASVADVLGEKLSVLDQLQEELTKQEEKPAGNEPETEALPVEERRAGNVTGAKIDDGEGVTITDQLDNGIFPDGATGFRKEEVEAINEGRKTGKIKVFRAVVKGQPIRPGDFVTLLKSDAELYLTAPGTEVVEMEVPIDDVHYVSGTGTWPIRYKFPGKIVKRGGSRTLLAEAAGRSKATPEILPASKPGTRAAGELPPAATFTPPQPTETETIPPDELRPALRTEAGKVFEGKKGDTHSDIYAAQGKAEGLMLRVENPEHGFVHQGKFLSRDEAAKAIGQTDPLHSERLRELQTKDEPAKTPKSSTQLTLPPAEAKPFQDFARSIPDAEVYHQADEQGKEDYGIETEPHITVLYGLTEHLAAPVEKLIADHGPVTVTLGKMSLFKSDDYDVLKVEVESPELRALNKRIATLPNEQTHPDYTPHLTLAYLKKGAGDKYAGDTRFAGQQLTFDTLTFSPPSELRAQYSRAELPLEGKSPEKLFNTLAGNKPSEVKQVGVGFVPPKFEIKKPIKGPTGAAIVGYEWRSKMGEKWSNREGGYVEARVSDWDNSDTSQGTGREIVHVFYVERPGGKITVEGIRSAQNVLGISETRLMTIAKHEQAAQAYREQQEQSEAKAYDKIAVDTPAEAARNYRTANYSPIRSFEENDAIFRESLLFEKGGKFVRRGPNATAFMEKHGWRRVANDPAKQTARPGDATEATGAEQPTQTGVAQPSPQPPAASTPKKRVGRGVTAKSKFNRETEETGGDLLSFIADEMPMLSKTQARQTKGAEWWQRNKSDWDDAPSSLAMPHHNKIYGGSSTPNRVAQAAYDKGLIDEPTAPALWQAIVRASEARKGHAARRVKESGQLDALQAEHERWERAIAAGKEEVAVDDLMPGDVLDIEGERVEVIDRNKHTGAITVKDGRTFGEQVLESGRKIYVENIEGAEGSEPSQFAAGDASKQTETPEFRRWFGNSKVTDVVYHKSPNTFTVFNTDNEGSHFGSYEQASALRGRGNRKPKGYWLSIQNPIRLPDLGVWSNFDNVRSYLSRENIISGKQADDAWAAWQSSDKAGWDSLKHSLSELGYDGIVYENELEGSGDSYIAFKPEQIKSATGNRGTFDPSNPDIRYAVGTAPLWRDNILDALESWQNRGTPEQLLAHLAKTRGAMDEADWIGLREFLKDKPNVTKQQVADFVRANQVQLQEVTKGKEELPTRPKPTTAYEYWKQEQEPFAGHGNISEEFFNALPHNYRVTYENMAAGRTQPIQMVARDDTKFSQYQLPGGENYRELLLTLPDKSKPTFSQWLDSKGYDADEVAKRGTESRRTFMEAYAKEYPYENRPKFQSSHFDEPNVLLHVRFNERTDADGKRVLFLEEVQSDWHQKGRKEGYARSAQELDAIKQRATALNDQMAHAKSGTEWDELRAEQVRLTDEYNKGTQGPPNAPFKQTWPMVAVKRMIRYAAENGFDRIAWTTGEQQAERYDLSKQVDRIAYGGNSEELIAYKNGEQVLRITVPANELAEHIGKEAADKIIEQINAKPDELATLEGEQLKVGGKGMIGFYDKILHAEVNKFVRKWGGKVGKTNLNTAPSVRRINTNLYVRSGEPTEYRVKEYGSEWRIQERAAPGEPWIQNTTSFKTENDAVDWIAGKSDLTVHSLDITPAMKDAAMQGMPLFAAPGRELTPDAAQATIRKAIHEKHAASERSLVPGEGRFNVDDVRARGQSTFARVIARASRTGENQVWQGAEHDPDFYATSAGQRLSAVAAAHGVGVTFFTGPPTTPRGLMQFGSVVLRSSLPEAELLGVFEHELGHHAYTGANPTLFDLADLVTLDSPTARGFRDNYNRWLTAHGIAPISDARAVEELVCDFVSGRNSFPGINTVEAFTDLPAATELAMEYHRTETAKMAAGDFSFDEPESVTDQKARLARERGAEAQRKAKDDMLTRADERLTAADVDTTGEMFGSSVKVDKAGQGSLFTPGTPKTTKELIDEWEAAHKAFTDVLSLKWVKNRPPGMKPAEAHQAIALAAARLRIARDELLANDEYLGRLMQKISASIKAGADPTEFEPWVNELNQADPKRVARVRAALIARGVIPDSQPAPLEYGRKLDELTAWLRRASVESPGQTLSERLNVAQAFRDRFHGIKDGVEWIGMKLATAGKTFVAQYKAPPTDTPFRSLFKNWKFNDEWTGQEIHAWKKSLEQQMPNPVRRQALTVWIDAGGDTSLLKFQADAVPDRFQRVWKIATALTPSEQAIGRQIIQNLERMKEDGVNAGLIEHAREEYGMPQVWQKPPAIEGASSFTEDNPKGAPGNPAARLDPRNPFFSFRREVDSYFSGVMAGGVPKSLDAAELVAHYHQAFHKSLNSRAFIAAARNEKAADGLPLVQISGMAQEVPLKSGGRGYVVNSGARPTSAAALDGRPYMSVDHWAMKDWKMVFKDSAGKPIMVRGDMLIHPDHYDFLKNELGESALREGITGRLLRPTFAVNAYLKASKLAIAGFHLLTIAEHMASHLESPLTRGFRIDLRDPDQALLTRHGLELGMATNHAMFMEGLASHGGLFKQIPGLGTFMANFSDWMFRDYIPTIMMKVGLHAFQRNLKRYGKELTRDQVAELTATQMNAAGGLLNYRQMGRNKTIMDIGRLAMLAPMFLEARGRVVAQAFKPYHHEQRKLLIVQALALFIMARILNALFNQGDPRWEERNWFRVVVGNRAYGLRTIVGDLFHLINDPNSFASGRLSPISRTAIEAGTGRDLRTGANIDTYFQAKIPRTAEIAIRDLLSWLAPVGVEGVLPGQKAKEVTPASMALTSIGVGSTKETANMQVYDWAKDFNQGHDARAQEWQKQHDNEIRGESAYRKLDVLLSAGETRDARKEYDTLVRQGHSPQAIGNRFTSLLSRPFTGTKDREELFIAKMTDRQRVVYAAAMEERRQRVQNFVQMLGQAQSANPGVTEVR